MSLPSVSLAALRKGVRATVVSLSAASAQLRHRLLSLGIVHGTEVTVTEVAPLGDPIDVRVLNSKVALRLSEAAQILVVPTE